MREVAKVPLIQGDFRGLTVHWECLINSKIYYSSLMNQ